MEQAAGNDPLIGAKVGNYEVRQKLGEGGMGSVYLAEHPLIGKKVALKVLHSEFASNQDVVSRFFTEAKAVNDIQHPNIVDIIDYGTIQQTDGTAMVYFIMEFLEGLSLADLIRTQAPLSPERALRICIQIADAVGASHRNNIVHRDLKPDNVILIKRRHEPDFVKVLDFGIAKLTGDQPGSRRTRTGIVMGTPAYMSPEQCEGRGEVDHRTDIYALGILLYEMLTAKVPFEGEGYGEVLVQHLTQPPARPSTIRGMIPPHVEAVCLRALEKRLDDRYPSMDEFIRALTDPVAYVQAAGGPEYFTSATMGAPQLTPYPAAQVPLTPLPGQVAPVNPTPMPQPQATWPTPPPVTQPEPNSKKTAVIAGVVLAIGLAIGGFVLFGGGGDKKAAGDGDGDGTAIAEGSGSGTAGAGSGTAAGSGSGTGADVTIPPKAIDAGVPVVTIDAAPPEPKKTIITIESDPAGASVYNGREKIGTTPFDWEVEAADKQVRLRIKRNGYKDRRVKVDLRKNEKYDFTLEKKRGGGSTGSGSGTGGNSGDPDNTINPFGD